MDNLIYLFVEADLTNLIAPVTVAGCWIPKKHKAELTDFVQAYSSNPPVERSLKLVRRFVQLKCSKDCLIYSAAIPSFQIDRYGLDIAINRAVRQTKLRIDLQLKEPSLTVAGCSDSRIDLKQKDVYCHSPTADSAESIISTFYAKGLRWSHLKSFNSDRYSFLDIESHKGRVGYEHLNKLLNLRTLPFFYIRYITFYEMSKYLIKMKGTVKAPVWYTQYLNHFGHLYYDSHEGNA